MQKAVVKKIKSAPKIRRNFLIGGLIVALLAVTIFGVFLSNFDEPPANVDSSAQSKCLVLGTEKCAARLEVVDNEHSRTLGLSGRSSLDEEEGMLFVFDQPESACFWMKDMNFAIDMVWLDSTKQIIKIENNVLPSTYPTSFCPDVPAQYVIELNAGKSAEFGFKVGQNVQF